MLGNFIFAVVMLGTLIYAFINCMKLLSMWISVNQKNKIDDYEHILRL